MMTTACKGIVSEQMDIPTTSPLSKKPTLIIGRNHEAKLLFQAYERCKSIKLRNNAASVDATLSKDLSDSAMSPLLSNQTATTVQPIQLLPQELVLIQGASGTGKTALAKSLRPHVRSDSGFFLTGKFELNGAQKDPYAVYVSAFTQFSKMLLLAGDEHNDEVDRKPSNNTVDNNDDEATNVDNRENLLEAIRQVIHEAVGVEGHVLTTMIPALEGIMGQTRDNVGSCQMIGRDAALHRFRFVFCNFCRAISTVVPLVLFLDDLQWSDQASLELLQELLQPLVPPPASPRHSDLGCTTTAGPKHESLLVIGAYRNDVVVDYHSNSNSAFHQYLRECWNPVSSPGTLRVTEITLENLNEDAVQQLVSASIGSTFDSSAELAKVVHDTSCGNIFHALQYLHKIINSGTLYIDPITHKPTLRDYDLDQPLSSKINDNNVKYDSVESLVRIKIESMSTAAQQALQVAACIGDDVDVSTLSLALSRNVSDISKELDEAVREGLLSILLDEGRYQFTHDRFRQMAISMIKNIDEFSFKLGCKLWKGLSPILLKASIYTVANLVNRGIEFLDNQEVRYDVAELNLEAGMKAASLAAFPDASRYLAIGIQLLQGGDYWTDKYNLALNLYNLAADVELCNHRYELISTLTTEVFTNGRCCRDKMSSFITQVNAMGQNGSLEQAVNLGLEALRQLGEALPTNPQIWMVVADLIKTKIMIRGRSNKALLSLKPMVQEDKLAAMHTLSFLVTFGTQAGSLHIVFIGTRLVQLTLKYGLSKASAIGFCLYACLLCRSERKQAYRFGQLALAIVDKLRAREVMPRVHTLFYYLLNHWSNPLRESLRPLKKASRAAMEIGDVEYASGAALFHAILAMHAGLPLVEVEKQFNKAIDTMRHYKHENFLEDTLVRVEMIRVLTSHDETTPIDANPCSIVTRMLHPFATNEPKNKLVALIHYSCGASLAYTFGEIDLAMTLVQKRMNLKFDLSAEYFYAVDQFQHALIAIAAARNGVNRTQNIKVAKQQWNKMRTYAKECPANFLNKELLVQAEIRSLLHALPSALGRRLAAGRMSRRINRLYGEAFEQSMREGFVHEAALSCELAGDFMYRLGEMALAATYWTKARDLYVQWGAKAKAWHLQHQTQKRLQTTVISEPARAVTLPGASSAALVPVVIGAMIASAPREERSVRLAGADL